MSRLGATAFAVTFMLTGAALAQGDAKKDLTNCPPAAAGTSGTAAADAQAVEKSAILPSAEQHEKSAAPTVQRDGKSVEARADCPQDPKQPKPKG